MAATLTQKISLEGAEKVQQQVKDLANGVEGTFQKIKASVESLGQGQGLDKAATQLFSFGEKAVIAATVVGAAATAVIALGKSFANMASEAAKGAAALGRAADTAGQSLENYQKTNFVLQQSGLTAQEAGKAMQKFGDGVSKALSDAREQASKLGAFFAPTEAGFNALAQSFGLFANKAGKSASEIKDAYQSIADASRAIIDSDKDQINADRDLEASKKRLAAVLQNSRAKAGDIQRARQDVAAAELKASDAEEASIERGIAARRRMAEAQAQLSQARQRQAKEVADAENATLEVMKRSGAAFDPVTRTLREDTDAWAKLADSIAAIKDPVQQANAVFRIFGETEGRRLLPILQKGGAAFRAQSEDFKRLGLGLTEAQRKIADELEKADKRLDAVRNKANRDTGLALAPFIIPIKNKLAEVIADFNRGTDAAIATTITALKQMAAGTFDWGALWQSFVAEGMKRIETTKAELNKLLTFDWGKLWANFLASGKAEIDKTKAEIEKLLSIDWGKLWQSFLTAGQVEINKTKAEIEKLLSIDWGKLWAGFLAAGKAEIVKTIAEIEKIAEAIKKALGLLSKLDKPKGTDPSKPEEFSPSMLPGASPISFTPGQQSGTQQIIADTKSATTAIEILASTSLQIIQSLAKEAATALGAALIEKVKTAGQSMTEFGTVSQTVATAIQTAINSINVDSVIAKLTEAIAKAQELANLQLTGPEDFSIGFARGGYTGNVGRSRVAGVVHGGEHVQPAWVVARPGMLEFLETLRRTGGDLRAAYARHMRGFSAGGLVDSLSRSLSPLVLPGYADGGLVLAGNGASSGRPVTFIIEGKKFSGFSGSNDAIDALGRASISRQIASTGKSPSWVR